jgi:methyltransferase
MSFVIFIVFVVCIRIGELIISRRNEKWLLENGAVEYGHGHYPFIVALHTLFIVSMLIEYYLKPVNLNWVYLLAFIALILSKIWIITSLGVFWNTKIYRIAGYSLIKKGPYKYVKHPNYIIVVLEIFVIPMTFGLYYTAIIFTLLNFIMLSIRIKVENKALKV